MLSLILQIVFGAGFGLGVKTAQLRGRDMIVVGGLNYIFAGLFGFVWFLTQQGARIGWAGGVFGGLNGVGYFVAYFFLIYAIRHQGVAATSAVGQLSILMPILLSIFLWGEYPTPTQLAGMAVAGVSILMLDARKDLLRSVARGLRWRLAAFFLTVGTVRVVAKAFSEAHVPEQQAFYVWVVYLASGSASLVMLWKHGRLPSRREYLWGAGIGACNMLQVAFLLRALQQLPGIFVFPIAACGVLLLTSLVAVLLLGERPTRRLYAGVAASLVAVFLLNWGPPTGS